MCLAIPLKITKINKGIVTLETGVKTKTSLIKHLKPGDFVLVQQGIVLQKLSPVEARKTRKFLKELVIPKK